MIFFLSDLRNGCIQALSSPTLIDSSIMHYNSKAHIIRYCTKYQEIEVQNTKFK